MGNEFSIVSPRYLRSHLVKDVASSGLHLGTTSMQLPVYGTQKTQPNIRVKVTLTLKTKVLEGSYCAGHFLITAYVL